MKNLVFLFVLFALLYQNTSAQYRSRDDSWKHIYRAFPEKINDMVHTRLEAGFDYGKSQLNGKVWLTLTPHFYDTDSLELDAKGMDIHEVQLVDQNRNIPLKYTYDSLKLNINLGKSYSAGEEYTVYIDYTAKPNDFVKRGYVDIGAKGLYFVNPDGKDKDKPIQVWTQGETEGNSVWVPMIDKPNQKSTQELILTVPDKYVSLSNGLLVNQQKNSDGTRTDTWRMDKPNSSYLYFFGIGDYAIVKDSYKGKEVSYYVERQYEDVARKIFGYTPEMMAFFSEKLGVEYPWVKYAQMTAHDYVAGAMENTSATLHMNTAQQNARELTDGNRWEDVISHELFHQWFGDLVTTESWSNITVNESFADFGEGMWAEYKHGKDDGEAVHFQGLNQFLSFKRDSAKSLVRHYYANHMDVFDVVSYQKGGSILNMLKNYLGDDAFYQALHTYLVRYSYGNGNASKLQQAFEDVTGKDMHWFFDQWYYAGGYPELDISYGYDEQNSIALVYVSQKQTARLFKLPVKIDVYEGDIRTRYTEWIENAADTFRYKVNRRPDLINVDADKILVAGKTDHKTFDQYVFQYAHGTNYVDRWEAVDFAINNSEEDGAVAFLQSTLNDPNYRIRIKTLRSLESKELNKEMLADISEIAKSDPNKPVAAEALRVLGQQQDKKYRKLFISSLTDSSYSVAGAAYAALIDIDEKTAVKWLPELKNDAKGALESSVKKAEVLTKSDADFDDMYAWISDANFRDQFRNLYNFIFYLGKVNNTENFEKGVKKVTDIRDRLSRFAPNYGENVNKELQKVKEVKQENEKGKLKSEMSAQIQILDKVLSSDPDKS